MKNVLIIIALLLFVSTTSEGQSNTDADYASFGEKITAKKVKSYEKLLKKLSKKDSVETKIVANVDAVCQMKGCWMNIGEESGTSTKVRFKDYGFFVPKDIAGKEVIVEGVAFKEITSVNDLRHYAEDAGKPKAEIDAITEPKEEIMFIATGVLVKN
jgi:hypothetical protein